MSLPQFTYELRLIERSTDSQKNPEVEACDFRLKTHKRRAAIPAVLVGDRTGGYERAAVMRMKWRGRKSSAFQRQIRLRGFKS